ncbi:pituitary tumor-transforming gene 1 protein-interacting protein [Gadus macrocephalus]|uniref:pituitary tumor-transforming gene 1 protein-interacting protein n=1 Tax=Gadus macrocephalus TaxID=80720 RepID=UPI0028CB4FC0|nr:pituitary tumor-transforming gene 1 protein-interacting protein [Gadus macrocephalus]
MTNMNHSHKNCVAMSVFFTVVLFVFIGQTECQTDVNVTPPAKPCSASTTCNSCLQSSKCLWCYTNDTCTDYPVSHLLPSSAECKLSDARWGVCWVNFEVLIIAMAMLAGSILIAISVCCCWCCCCRRCRSGPDQDDEQFTRRREEIRQRAEERTGERKNRHEDIRRKYGLMADSSSKYSKLENE